MKENESPIINMFAYRLPRELARPIYNEFHSRFAEASRIIHGYEKYKVLEPDLEIIEILLALSIFYNRVLANLQAANKFFGLVTANEQTTAVKIGSYILNNEEIETIESLLITYRKIMRKYQLSESLWNYNLTIDFLQQLLIQKSIVDGK